MASDLPRERKPIKNGARALWSSCNPKELWLQWLLPELQPEFVRENAIEMNRYWRRAIGEGKLFPIPSR
jgi:hypothetical protein